MNWDVIDNNGKKVSSIELPADLFELEMNEHVLHSMVMGYRANRRQGTHATKTRSFVSGGGKKPFKQKGTGGARQGSSRSPLMPGGGTAHGPQPRSYRQALNKKTKQLALKIALSDKVRHQRLFIVDDFRVNEYKTKQMVQFLKVANLATSKVLIGDERQDTFLYRSTRNLRNATCLPASQINTENVLGCESLVVSLQGIQGMIARLGEAE
jgi:large subunit ribosomal protein L4